MRFRLAALAVAMLGAAFVSSAHADTCVASVCVCDGCVAVGDSSCLQVAGQCVSWFGHTATGTPGGGQAACDYAAPDTANGQVTLAAAATSPGYRSITLTCVVFRSSDHAVLHRSSGGFPLPGVATVAFSDAFTLSTFEVGTCLHGIAFDAVFNAFGNCPSGVS